ncbi:hypothetical protein ACOME3_009648 [Neoechinorhynchus agilis]
MNNQDIVATSTAPPDPPNASSVASAAVAPAGNFALSTSCSGTVTGNACIDSNRHAVFKEDSISDQLVDMMDCIQNYTVPSSTKITGGGLSKQQSLTRPAIRRLMTLINGIAKQPLPHEDSSARLIYFNNALRNCRSLIERLAIDFLMLYQNQTQITKSLWLAVRNRGCQFLGPAMQEETLKLVLVALGDGSALSRKMLVLFVVQKLQPHFPRASKTSIGHVVQLLYRASCFKLQKRQEESSLMQLKEEFRTYEALRREHDAQIAQIAMDAGLRISPETWSILLYGDANHKYHMNAVIDRISRQPIQADDHQQCSSTSQQCSSTNAIIHPGVQSFSQIISELKHVLQYNGDPFKLLPTVVADCNHVYHTQIPQWNAEWTDFQSTLFNCLHRISNCLFIYSTKSHVIQSAFRRHNRSDPIICSKRNSLSNSVEFLNLNDVAAAVSSVMAAVDCQNGANQKLHRRTWSNSMSSLVQQVSTSKVPKMSLFMPSQVAHSSISAGSKPTSLSMPPRVLAAQTHPPIAAPLPPSQPSKQQQPMSQLSIADVINSSLYELQAPPTVEPPPGLTPVVYQSNHRSDLLIPLKAFDGTGNVGQNSSVPVTAAYGNTNAEVPPPPIIRSAAFGSPEIRDQLMKGAETNGDLTNAIISLDKQIENLQIRKQNLLSQIRPIPLHPLPVASFDDPYDVLRRVESVPNLYPSSLRQQQQRELSFKRQHTSPSNYLSSIPARPYDHETVIPFSETPTHNKYGPISRDRRHLKNSFNSSSPVSSDTVLESNVGFDITIGNSNPASPWQRVMHNDSSTLRHAQSLPVIQDEEDPTECGEISVNEDGWITNSSAWDGSIDPKFKSPVYFY